MPNHIAPRLDDTLCDLFAAQLARTPEAEALVDGNERFTYRQLDAEIEGVAAALRQLGIGLECRVAVYLHRRAPLIAALLGVQRAGGAYVPLDPAYPSERTFAILEDAAPRVVLTQRDLRDSLPDLSCPVLTIEDLPAAAAHEATHGAHPDALAYLISTSGSTGKPKGVAIPHRCAVNLIRWAADYFPADSLRAMLFGTSVNFDLSIWEIFLPLSVGGKIVLAPNVLALPDLPARREITFINTVPSAIAELIRLGPLPDSVQTVALAGEAFRRELANRIFAHHPDLALFNLYAPSETTTYSTFTQVWPGADEPTIGLPLENTRVFVLDPALGLLPPGEVGELLIGGLGVTRGYLQRPALTAAAFVPDPFADRPGFMAGDRLYRTGDLVRECPDGELEFLGRRDHQVKIRGFRVELGEIEKTIEKDPLILRAAVLARRNEVEDLELIAYLEPEKAPSSPSEVVANLRRELKAKLPSYMVPGRFEVLAALPLLPNGKIDRKLLTTRPLPLREQQGRDWEEPRAGTERALAELIQIVLGVGDVSRHDHFVALGGHSLQAVRLAAEWRALRGVNLAAKDFLGAGSLAELATIADQLEDCGRGTTEQVLEGPQRAADREFLARPLTPAQERLYFLYRFEPGSAFYNESAAFEFRGLLDRHDMLRALRLLEQRHAALRTRFIEIEGAPFQLLLPTTEELELPSLAASRQELDARLGRFIEQPFDLATSRPWRCILVELANEESVLAIAIHHLVFDGISLEIIENELAAAYSAFRRGEEPDLPPLPYSFADFSEWQRQRLNEDILAAQVEFWRQRLGDAEPLELPLDHPRPAEQSFRGGVLRQRLPASLVRTLEGLGRREGATPFLTFLAPFLVLLSRLSGQSLVRVGAPFAGRDVAGSECLVGYFVNALVLEAEMGADSRFDTLLAELRQELAEAMSHQDVPLERLVAELTPQRDSSRNPLFQATFQLFEGDPGLPAFASLAARRVPTQSDNAKFELELFLEREPEGGLNLKLNYATDLFEQATIRYWLDLYSLLLQRIAEQPRQRLDEIDLPPYRVESRVSLPRQTGRLKRRPTVSKIGSAPGTVMQQQIATAFGQILGLEGLSLESDFFALGGHSLLATRLIAKVHQLCGIEVPMRVLFAHPSVAAFAAATEALAGKMPQEEGQAGRIPAQRELSLGQQRLYFLHRFDPSSAVYNLPAALILRGHLDPQALRSALAAVEERQEILRTRFREEQGIAYPVVMPANELQLAEEKVAPAMLAPRLRELAEEGFDLLRQKPWRVCLLDLGEAESVLFFCVHHIAFDGLSLAIFENELAAFYRAALLDEKPDLPPLPWSYGAYAGWQQSWLEGQELESQIAFWKARLATEPLELPADRPRPAIPSFRGQILEHQLDASLVRRLEQLGREQGATPFLTFLAPFLMLLARLSGQQRTQVGVPFSGRHAGKVENLVGFFVNSLVLAADLTDDPSLIALLPRLREEFAQVYARQDVPFDKLVSELQVARDASRNPIFQVGFQLFERDGSSLDFAGLEVHELAVDLPVAKLDFDLLLERRPAGEMMVRAWYASDLFDASTVSCWLELYALLLQAVADRPSLALSRISLVRPTDRALYAAINATQTDYPRESTLNRQFAARAAVAPQAVAAEHHGDTVTYQELDERSNRLARRLSHEGAVPGAMVGVCLERGLDLIVALLAVVKTGAAYVPLDADYPAERLKAMMEDCHMPIALTLERQLPKLPAAATRLLLFDRLEEEARNLPAGALPAEVSWPDSAAYVIFTSGSTGRPKGVVIPHRGVLRLVCSTTLFTLAPGEVVAQISTVSFDAYTIELWGALLNGGHLLVIDRDTQLDFPAFAAAIDRDIALLPLNASFFAQCVLEHPKAFVKARYLFFGGEASDPGIVRRALAHKPTHLKNTYGPTECTMLATAFEVQSLAGDARSVPIGKPISNTEALILERSGHLAPVGVHGELCLGGDGLAWGYWGRPALTAKTFVPHPYGKDSGARLYRTGDLCRLLPSGDIEYLGRLDSQVKVRGFRIELGEIEGTLGRHPAVREKVVITKGEGAEQRLVAFVVVRQNEKAPVITAGELRQHCAESLPSYAVPLVRVVQKMPLTPGGKVDRKALWGLEASRPTEEAQTPPRSELESQIAAAFGELLGLSGLGLEAEFFRLGGHSLLGIRLMARIRELTGIEIPVRTLFVAPTVGALAIELAKLAKQPTQDLPAWDPGSEVSDAERQLSFAQQRLFFLHRFDPDSAAYNIPAAFRLRGPLDREALRSALEAIETRQEILRTRFRESEGMFYPVLLPVARQELETEKIDPAELADQLREQANRSFDLLRERPWRKLLFELAEDDHVLFLNVHHIAFDGLSLALFEKELAAFYGAARRSERAELPSLPWSYADFAEWQRTWLRGEELERQLAFWRARALKVPLELPTDRPRPPFASFRGGELQRHLDADLVNRVEGLGRQSSASPFLSFLAPFLMLLSRLSGGPVVQVGVPFSGRHSGEVENLMGFFVNSLLLSANLDDDPSLAKLLPRLREDFAAVFAHQDVPFEKLVEELQTGRDPSRNPLFQVAFQLFERGGAIVDFDALTVERVDVGLNLAKFDLDVSLERGEQGDLLVSASYATDLFRAETVDGWLELYEILLRQVVAEPQRPISSFPLLRPADRALYSALNQNASAFPREASLASLFAQQVQAGPTRIAAEFRGRLLTYRQLDEQTNRLGHFLRRQGIRPGSMVGLCFERGLELAVAILAVIKTGAAYVPLDGDYPEARLRSMAEDTAMPILLGSSKQLARLPDLGMPMLAPEALAAELERESTAALPDPPGGLAPAVVIFTSGSTGKPKGVVVTQRAICRLVIDTNYIDLQPGDVVAQVAAASFDVYTFEIWGALLRGGRLLVIDRETLLEPRAFAAVLAGRDIAALFLTVALFSQMTLEEPQAFSRVRHLLFGGEACEPSIVRRALQHKMAHLQNGYGPAECTTYATTCDISFLAEDAGSVPIGKPVANTEVLVLDRAGQPASVGVHGELCLAGDGLALGYWRRPALTAQAFAPHPCSPEPGARLYRTGDLGRLLPSGDFDYLGRIDFQVKVRGFRIELGEVEAVLGRHPAVHEKIVLKRGKGFDQMLVAFVVVQRGDDGEAVAGAGDLQRFCAETLPAFSVPLVHLVEAMPVTPNGKIDRQALLRQPSGTREESLTPPRPGLEQEIAVIFGEVVGASHLGRESDFFALGGHSLLAARLISRLRSMSRRELPIRLLFEAPTVAGLAKKIEELEEAQPRGEILQALPEIERLPRPEGVPAPTALSASQEQLFFLQSLDPEASTFNMALLWRLDGQVDARALELACGDLIARYEILRTRFELVGGKPCQIVQAEGVLTFQVQDLQRLGSAAEAKALELARAEARQAFDLSTLPLLRFQFFILSERHSLLLINLHHLLGDGRSFEIIWTELEQAYLARLKGEVPAWLPLPLHYADFAVWQQQQLAHPAAQELLAKQLARLRGTAYDLDLASDHPRVERTRRRGDTITKRCPEALARRARHFSPVGGTSIFMTLLAAFEGLLCRYSGREDLYVGTPIADRPRPELENQIGFFVNTAVLRVDAGGDPSFVELLSRTRLATLEAFEAKDLPYGRLVEKLDRSGEGLFQVFFSYDRGEAQDYFAGMPRTSVDLDNGTSQFELTFFVGDTGSSLELLIEYDTDLFRKETIENALNDYLLLLERAFEKPQSRLSELLPQPRWPRRRVEPKEMLSPQPPSQSLNSNSQGSAAKLTTSQKELLAARLAKAKAAKLAGPAGPGRQPSRALVPIETRGDGPPLFCVHPAGGDVLCFEPLARHLGRPLYGLQSRGLVPGSNPDTTIPAMAEAYLDEITGLATGPIHLAGWSLGGMVAFEMACQLEKKGRRPELVAIFDSLPALPPRADLSPEAFADDTRFLLDIADYARGFWGKDFRLDESALRAARGEAKLELFLAALRDTGFLPPGARSLDLRRLLDVFKANTRAAYEFEPSYYGGRIELFVALDASPDTESSETKREADLGWSRHAAAVGIHPVAANHVNLIAEPHVAEVAAILLSLIGNER